MEAEYERRRSGDTANVPKNSSRLGPALIVLAILASSALAAYLFVPAVQNIVHPSSASNTVKKGAVTSQAVKYTCPMHPFIVSDRPGACPICGMSLVSRDSVASQEASSAAHAHLPGGVAVSPTQRVMANVETAKAEPRVFSTDTVAAGRVSWDERRLSRVSARVPGRVERLHVGISGARVGAGQPLLDIFSPELASSQKEYLLAVEGAERAKESSLSDSRSMMEGVRDAARSRLKLLGLTDGQINDLARTRQPKAVVTVFSPAAGVVTERLVTAGQYVNEGAVLFSVAPISDVRVNAELYENEVGRVVPGTPAVVTTDAYPGREFRGRVEFVDTVVNPETRTLKVRVELANQGGLLKPEMFVKVAFRGHRVRALAVPEDAVVVTGDHSLAWVETALGSFEPRSVTIGRRGGGFCEVLSGLAAGESVAASGGFLIDSESQLRSVQSASTERHRGEGR